MSAWRLFEPVAVHSRKIVGLLAWAGIYPRPRDFDRMPTSRFDAYVRSIGFEARIKAALAASEPGEGDRG